MTDTALETSSFDLAPLLAPIPGDNAVGEWLRFDPLYDEIRRLREEDDPALPQGVWQRELKRADWSGIAERATKALSTRTKDLQIAAWLTEAWLHVHGFRGLTAGLQLIAALCREYWESIYPPIEGENFDSRLAPVAWAAEKLVLAAKRVPITAPAGEDEVQYAWIDSELALYEANLAKSKGKPAGPPENGVVTHPKFLVSVSLTPATWYAELSEQVHGTLAAIDELEDVLVQLAGESSAPSMTPMRTPLVSINAFISRVLAERVQSGELAPWAVGDAEPPFEGPDLDAPRRGARITSRADAFQRLREAAEYLMRTEPHSPVPYLVRRAISWEHMSLAELLEELLSRNTDLNSIYALLGIRR